MYYMKLDVADCYIQISSLLINLSTLDHRDLDWFLNKFSETLEKLRVSSYNLFLLST